MGKYNYKLSVKWTGNKGTGTSHFKEYERSHQIQIGNKLLLEGSADAPFHGDKTKCNPEELLLAALSSCHLLSYLYVCTKEGVVVLAYSDESSGTLSVSMDGSGHFTEVTLRPNVIVADKSMIEKANELHSQAKKLCFIANSVKFVINHEPICSVFE